MHPTVKANTVARKNLNLHSYEVRPRDDRRGVDLISDALPFGRLWYGEPNAISDAIGYAKFRSRSHDAVIPVYDESGQRDRDAQARGRFQRGVVTVSLPCRLKILLTRFNESLYRNAGVASTWRALTPSDIRQLASGMDCAECDVSGSRRRCLSGRWSAKLHHGLATSSDGAKRCGIWLPTFIQRSIHFFGERTEVRAFNNFVLFDFHPPIIEKRVAGVEEYLLPSEKLSATSTPPSQRIPPRLVLSVARAVQPSGRW